MPLTSNHDPTDWERDDSQWDNPLPKKGKGKPRLPWKRGPCAWEIARRAETILVTLKSSRRGFYSLRGAAKLMGVSTQPLRDWIRLGHLKREGSRQQISRFELERFIDELVRRAEPFDSRKYRERFPHTWPFKKLGCVRLQWPKGRKALSPRELAALAGCHPSLIRKAIHSGFLRVGYRSNCRFEVTRQNWLNSGF
jgi:hypothetical protein